MKNIVIRENDNKKTNIKSIGYKIEDILLDIIMLLPEKMIPLRLVERYIYRRNTDLQSQQIKNEWRKVDLIIAKQIIDK